MAEGEREEFLAQFSTDSPEGVLGFAVMGGIFGEGIDLVGNRLIGAIIVGVGLPQLGLEKDLIKDSVLNVYSNGEINYTLKGVHAKASVIWNYEAPDGAKDTHYSIMRGTNANLIIQQGAEENYEATLYVENTGKLSDADFMAALQKAVEGLQIKYPGITIENNSGKIVINIPDRYKNGHEAHFTQVTEKYLEYLKAGKLPDWEVPNMIAKYYTTTKAYEMSR